MPVKVLAVTGSRSDWGLMVMPLKALRDDPAFDLKLAITGQYLVPKSTDINRIKEDGFDVSLRVDMGLISEKNDAHDVTKALGRSVSGFADVIQKHKPDFMLALGDRYETLGAVSAALLNNVPVVHLYGGDITEGAFDDSIRHAITKMSHVHFVTNEDSRKRIIRMGERPERVFNVGSPALDQIHKIDFLEKEDFFHEIGFEPRKYNLIVTFHPVTLEKNSFEQCQEMLLALDFLGDEFGFIITGSNADPQGFELSKKLSDYASVKENAKYIESLGTRLYYNALNYCNAIVGNSSSGLYEAPSFSLPAVNIGTRQKGRLRADNVLDVDPESKKIEKAIRFAVSRKWENIVNPYGDGKSTQKIIHVLKKIDDFSALVKKSFFDGDQLC